MILSELVARFNETQIVNKFLDLNDDHKLYKDDALSMNFTAALLELAVGIILFTYFAFVWLRRRIARARREVSEDI